ncbi:hypothetical protein [Devosia sp. SL43]|uniref:hypothetical protein n=1 Tax=Devosia sp. SL43 TaxID=2806348 RepID=UPI001F48D1E9|nr:hypothetical protein [Devosia sp. SL43]UJW85102.1 hypothetical protein IM737_17085 [Devosia sp. SL43]
MLESRFEGLVRDADQYLQDYANGRPAQRNLREAYEVVLKVRNREDRREVIVAVMAMGYLHELDMSRFEGTVDAFGFQLARMFRSYAPSLSVGVSWDHQKGKPKNYYRDTSAKTMRTLAGVLMETGLPTYGAHIAKKVLEDKQRRRYQEDEALSLVLGTPTFKPEGEQ